MSNRQILPKLILQGARTRTGNDHKTVTAVLGEALLLSILTEDNGLREDVDRLVALSSVLEWLIAAHTKLRIKVHGSDLVEKMDDQAALRLQPEIEKAAEFVLTSLHGDVSESAATLTCALAKIVPTATDPIGVLEGCLWRLRDLHHVLQEKHS